ASICDKVFTHGKTQKVYKTNFQCKQYVAKHFFDIGDGPDTVSIASNQTELEKEGIRLAQASYFLDCHNCCLTKIMLNLADICITNFLLALEII
ncbi:hypothetical protein GYMLUDRAFT_988170, partial [Collybiopsis luxurians FD-317 M1]